VEQPLAGEASFDTGPLNNRWRIALGGAVVAD
jgi:hypothetical protein